MTSADEAAVTEYGARPVSIDLARGRRLVEATAQRNDPSATIPPLPVTHQVVADRLSLAHWPQGHRIVICSLDGGTGRTTFCGLLATVLAELPFSHIWPPIAAVELVPHPLGSTAKRWDLVGPLEPETATGTRSGAWAFTGGRAVAEPKDFSAIVLDAAPGLPSELSCVSEDPGASIVVLTRPDRASLAETAEALVWMHDRSRVSRSQTVVVINDGVGQSDRGSKAAATALGIRSSAVHRLPFSWTLGPGRALPSGRDLPTGVRRCLSHVALDVWTAVANRRTENRRAQARTHRSPLEDHR